MEPGLDGSRWYYVRNGERHGPIGEGELKELLRGGGVGPNDYVWHEAMPDWQEAKRVPNLVPSLIPGSSPADTVPFNAPLSIRPAEVAAQPQQFEPQGQPHARQQPFFEPQQPHFQSQAQFQPQAQYPTPQPYGGGPPGHYLQQPAHFVPQAYASQHPHFTQQPYPTPAPQYVPAFQQVAVVNQPRTTTTGLKVAGFIFNIIIFPGTGSFFVSRPGQAVAQILLWILGFAISLTGVGAVIGVPMMIGTWIWGIVTVATVPTAPSVAIVHHTYHAPR